MSFLRDIACMKPKYLTIAVLGISRAYFETFPPLFAYDGGGCGGGGGGGGRGQCVIELHVPTYYN